MNAAQARKRLSSAKRIAVVRTDRLGDLILTLPLCNALKARYPHARITLITRSYTAALVRNSPALDEVIFIDKKKGGIREVFSAGKYDVAFFPRPVFEEIFWSFASRVKLRVGSAFRWYSFLLNFTIPDHRKTAERHEAEYNTRMLGLILEETIKPELVPPVIDFDTILSTRKALDEAKISLSQKFIVIHPGSGGSAKDWPAERFGEAAKLIAEHYSSENLRVIITGIRSEEKLCKAAADRCPGAVNLCGKLSLGQMSFLLSQASLLIANSTGVLHIAASFGIPVLGLYPNTPSMSAERWGPYSRNAITISPKEKQSPEQRDNMLSVEVAEVAAAAAKLLSRWKQS